MVVSIQQAAIRGDLYIDDKFVTGHADEERMSNLEAVFERLARDCISKTIAAT